MQKLFRRRYAQPVQASRSALAFKPGAHLARGQSAYPRNRKTGKVNRDLLARERHVARNRTRRRTHSTPHPAILRHARHTARQHRPHHQPNPSHTIHLSRMPPATPSQQPMSCRTGPLRAGRSLRDVYTGLGRATSIGPRDARHDLSADHREAHAKRYTRHEVTPAGQSTYRESYLSSHFSSSRTLIYPCHGFFPSG